MGSEPLGGNLVLEVTNPGGAAYHVESSEALAADSWTVVASDQTGAQWTTPLQSGKSAVFYRLSRN